VDLEDFSSLMRVIERELPDMIFHIASMANVRDSFDNPTAVIKNNVAITLNLLEVIRLLKLRSDYNPTIQICSTSEVYGNVPLNYYKTNPLGINEHAPLLPINPYAVSKLTQDALSYVYWLNYDLKIIRTRMFSYFNAKRGNLFATAFAKQILEVERGEKEVLRHGALNSIRTMLDVRDAAEAYWYATNFGKPGEVYNIGGHERVSVGEVLELLKKRAKCEIPCVQDEGLLRVSDISIQVPDMMKFTTEIGWRPKYNLEQSIDFFWKEVNEYWSK
jgi:GDP-4-dehydro-6-deoxy-D-mannose reductase